MAPDDPRLLTRRGLLARSALAGGVLLLPGSSAAAREGVRSLPVDPRSLRRSGGWLVSDVLAAGVFELAGATWEGAGAPVQIRARASAGWTRWTTLPAPGEHAPERHRGAHASEPVWTGRSDRIQLRTRSRPRAVTLHLVNAGPSAPGAAAAQAPPDGRPPIVPRSQWGGDDYPPRTDPSYGEVEIAFVHHTVNANDYGPGDSAGIVRSICAYHRNVNKWNDIGYNLLVDKYGQIFEGRAGGVDAAVIGAQAQGYNSVSTGIACLGTYTDEPFADAGIDAVATLIAWKLPLHGRPVTGEVTVRSAGGEANRYPAGRDVTFARISGHRDADETACPGGQLYAQLPRIRELAAGRARAVAPQPRLSITAEPAEIVYPARVALSGTLAMPDGSSAAGQRVEIQGSSGGGSWKTIETVTTDGGGSWRATLKPERGIAVRARLAGRGSVSDAVRVAVRPMVTLKASSARKLPAGAPLQVAGTIRPAAGPVTLSVERRQPDGSYRTVRKVRAKVRAGRYKAEVKLGKPGLYRVRARFGGGGGLTKSRSERIYARVREGGGSGGQQSA